MAKLKYHTHTINITEKYCSQCRLVLPLNNFYKDSRAGTGRMSWCKQCRSKAGKIYRKNHPLTDEQKARLTEQQRAWYEKNKERYLAKKRISKRKLRAKKKREAAEVGIFIHTVQSTLNLEKWTLEAKEKNSQIARKYAKKAA